MRLRLAKKLFRKTFKGWDLRGSTYERMKSRISAWGMKEIRRLLDERDKLSIQLHMPWYVLYRGSPVHCKSVEVLALWELCLPQKRVGLKTLRDHRISTVFLGLDHAMERKGDCPVLWETAAFDRNMGDAEILERYESAEQAVLGHRRYVSAYQAREKMARQTVN